LTETTPKVKAEVVRALELDNALADAHVTRANFAEIGKSDWVLAEDDFQRAIELDPNSANAHFMYSDFLISMKRNEEWKAEIQRALELDPLNYFYQCFYGWHLLYLRRHDEAIAQFRKVLVTQPDFSSAYMGLWGAYYKKGMDAEALAAARQFFTALGDQETVAALDRGKVQGGYRGAMKSAGDTLAARARRSHVPAIRIARVYAHAGERQQAIDWLERAYERHDLVNLVHLGVGWDWDGLRAEPRFQALLRRLKLPQ
jgi:serine/threonine-protein kinase